MNNVLEDSLFVSQTKKFDEIQSIVRQFSAEYVGNSIIKDNIFAVIQNYARKKEIALELLRYPIHDDELWALTFLKQDTIFVCVNTALPLCKQFFAAAHPSRPHRPRPTSRPRRPAAGSGRASHRYRSCSSTSGPRRRYHARRCGFPAHRSAAR